LKKKLRETLSRKCRLERLEEGQTITVYVMVFNATFNNISVILWRFKPQQKNSFFIEEKDNNKNPFLYQMFSPNITQMHLYLHSWVWEKYN
jgi:hypothetical protein